MLPIPLHAPSTSRRADIFEDDMSFQKRLLLTSPTSRMEVGETSAVGTARQPGSTVAHTVDYSFVDTMDASIRSAERRTMAAIKVVKLRVSYQALARSEAHNRALEARIATIETQLHRMEWQRQDADDCAVRHIMRIQALEARARVDTLENTATRTSLATTTTTTTAVTDAQLKALISRGVADALAEIKTNKTSRNGDDIHDYGTGSRRTE
ncbi:hypothetical protein Tco_0327723 [Tanacetum coccineum]